MQWCTTFFSPGLFGGSRRWHSPQPSLDATRCSARAKVPGHFFREPDDDRVSGSPSESESGRGIAHASLIDEES
eukprot:3936429-Rhodomonas_salina.2